MFNRLPGAMLTLGHTHQWGKGLNCSRVLSQHTANDGPLDTPSHSLFNPASPEAELTSESRSTSLSLPSQNILLREQGQGGLGVGGILGAAFGGEVLEELDGAVVARDAEGAEQRL